MVKDLAAYQPDDWLNLIRESGVRPVFPEKLRKASLQLRPIPGAHPRTGFPTEAVRPLRRTSSPGQGDLLRFFDNSPNYQLTAHIDRYIVENADTALEGISDVEKLTRDLKELQRLYKVAPQTGRFEAIAALQAAGIGSAQAIARMGRERSSGRSQGHWGEAAANRSMPG
jgi:hypothetical protein